MFWDRTSFGPCSISKYCQGPTKVTPSLCCSNVSPVTMGPTGGLRFPLSLPVPSQKVLTAMNESASSTYVTRYSHHGAGAWRCARIYSLALRPTTSQFLSAQRSNTTRDARTLHCIYTIRSLFARQRTAENQRQGTVNKYTGIFLRGVEFRSGSVSELVGARVYWWTATASALGGKSPVAVARACRVHSEQAAAARIASAPPHRRCPKPNTMPRCMHLSNLSYILYVGSYIFQNTHTLLCEINLEI